MRSWNSGSRADDRLIHATQTAREKSITIIRIALVHDPAERRGQMPMGRKKDCCVFLYYG